MVARIPIAHLHGGETTEGVIDEAIRHAITKMAHFHFVAAEPYRRRVIQLGESPERVMNYGAPGLDHLKRLKLLNREEFESAINFTLDELTFLVTYHPVTLNKEEIKPYVLSLFEALAQFPNAKIIFTKSNADTNGRMINELIDNFVSNNPKISAAYTSLGQLRYLSALKHVNVVIGNSSSGIIEAPVFKKPTVNIGDRQRGRLYAPSIINCNEETQSIVMAIRKALSASFLESIKTVKSIYGVGDVSVKIKEYLKTVDLRNILKKKFYDL
jgi:UDP-N-acetylglucosamine 2-epimerase (non-hydrolysing)/GDP/UDP-N,N'-diacetylbacillosamine 2-epimerase (hydrolysing)